MWLSLRRTIAPAEIIVLPRNSVYVPSADRSENPACTRRGQTREEAGASLWQAACTMYRLAGCMFGLHITTRMYSLPTDGPVFVGTQLVPEAYFCRLADIAGKIPVLDDLYVKGQPSLQVCEMASDIDRELRELASLAPKPWWDLVANEKTVTPDRVFQYFINTSPRGSTCSWLSIMMQAPPTPIATECAQRLAGTWLFVTRPCALGY